MSMATLLFACLTAVSPGGGDTYFINQHQIRIPISIDPPRRPEIKEIHLFVSSDEGKTWNEQAVATPEQETFPFFAPRDGMYWFTVVVVNQQNQREPADPYSAPPSQKIVIDTVKPVIRFRAAERQGEEALVGWEIQEDYPDGATLRMEYRAAGLATGQWQAVPLTPALVGQARFRPNIAGPLLVRMQLQDLAGGFATAETELPAGSQSTMQLTAGGPAAVSGVPMPATQPMTGRPEARVPEPAPFTPGPPAAPAPVQANDPARLVATSDPQPTPALPPTASPPRSTKTPLPNLAITNNRQVVLDYEVTKVGPSGIGRVELWVTRDDGRTWERFAENPDLKPPLKVDLPTEGQYGFRLVLHSRAGRAQPSPSPGTVPELRLELDTTAPTAQLYRPEPDPKHADALVLSWTATDRNLAANPITLQWCEKLGQEWQTIVADHPNDRQYVWRMPPNMPYLVYLRLVATDTAGNTSVAETPEPICIDLKEPEGRILGIAGGARKPSAGDGAHRPGDPRDLAVPVSFEKGR
jgi:hypothetical protein